MSHKVTGYTLLIIGLCIMFYALFSVYMVFTNQSDPVDLFSFSGISLNLDPGNIELPQEAKDAGITLNQPQSSDQEIISPDILNESSNIIAHVIFMGFIVNVGFKIATLGVESNREVKVSVSNKSLNTANNNSVLLPK